MSGLDQISVVLVGYAAVLLLAAAYCAVRLRSRPPWLDSMAWFLELLAALRAAAGFGSLLSGHRSAEQSAYVGYLVASVCIIPIALASFRPDPAAAETGGAGDGEAPVEPAVEDRGVWSVGVVAVAALAVGVIGVRTMMTL